MGLTRSQADAQLAELYARIPRIPGCDGRCWTSCGPIGMSDRERQRIRQTGVRITPHEIAMQGAERYWCEALTGDKRCAVYELRPLICRLWGAVEGMPCVYGCFPEGGYLTDAEGYELIAESMRIGGGVPAEAVPVEAIREALASAHLQVERDRAVEVLPPGFRRPGGSQAGQHRDAKPGQG